MRHSCELGHAGAKRLALLASLQCRAGSLVMSHIRGCQLPGLACGALRGRPSPALGRALGLVCSVLLPATLDLPVTHKHLVRGCPAQDVVQAIFYKAVTACSRPDFDDRHRQAGAFSCKVQKDRIPNRILPSMSLHTIPGNAARSEDDSLGPRI